MSNAAPILRAIPIECLTPGRFQPRRDFDRAALAELAESIRAQGLIQPIVVRELTEGEYEIIAGERRWRASQLVGLKEVNCVVYDYHDEQAAAVALIENLSRHDLNPIEAAEGYKRLMAEFGYIQEEVAGACGVSRTKVANSLRLLQLDDSVKRYLESGELSDGHGKILAGLTLMQQRELAGLAVRNGWTVRTLDEKAKALQGQSPRKPVGKSIDVKRLEELLAEQLGTEVVIDSLRSSEGGWLKIRFYDNDTLAGILERVELEY